MTILNSDTFLMELYFSVTSFLGGQHKNSAAIFLEMLAIMDAQLSLMEMDVRDESSTYHTALASLQTLSDNLPGAVRLHDLLHRLYDTRGPSHTSERIQTLTELHKLVVESRDTLEAND